MDQHHSSRVGQDRRAVPRELKHPNSVTAPPINRGSMVPQPWRGFWNGIFTAILSRLVGGQGATPQCVNSRDGGELRRLMFALLTLASAGAATALFAAAQPD